MLLVATFIPAGKTSCAYCSLLKAEWNSKIDLPKYGVTGTLKAIITQQDRDTFQFSGKLIPKKFPISCGGISITGNGSFRSGRLSLKTVSVVIKKADLGINKLNLNSTDISISGKASYELTSGSITAREILIKAGKLPAIKASCDYSPTHRGKITVVINNSQDLIPVLIAASGFKNATGWTQSGNYALRFSIDDLSRQKPNVQLNVQSMSLASPNSDILADNMKLLLNGQFDIQKRELKAEIDIKQGEALYKTYYFNLNRFPIHLDLNYQFPSGASAKTAKINLDWSNLLKLTANLATSEGKDTKQGSCRIKSKDLSEVFKTFVTEPYGMENTNANGTLDCSLDFFGDTNSTAIDGLISISKANFSSKELATEDINLKLPVNIVLDKKLQPISSEKVFDPEQGLLSVAAIKFGKIAVENLTIPLTVSSRRIIMDKVPFVNFSNGTVNINKIQIDKPFSKDFRVFADLNLSKINLHPLSPPDLPISGNIGGAIKCWLLKDSLSTSGKLTGKLYDGNLEISEAYAEDPFSKNRQYGADIKITDLNLSPLSTAVGIGLITGRIDVSLKNLALAYGQPAAFNLIAKTSPDSGEKQISLKAINSLSVIGTGSGLTGLGVGAFAQFFKQFSYKSLGLQCNLDNDMFQIRGLIRENGVEYIIKRPIFFGVNVVNSNPENLISFSDMLKRIKRVTEDEENY